MKLHLILAITAGTVIADDIRHINPYNPNAGMPKYISPSLRVPNNTHHLGNQTSEPGIVSFGHRSGDTYATMNPVDGDPVAFSCHGYTKDWLAFFHINFLRNCDIAVNERVVRKPDYMYTWQDTTSGGVWPYDRDKDSRPCWADETGDGCGIEIEGEGCQRSGEQIWWDYQAIREVGGCGRTGSYLWDLDDTAANRGGLNCLTKIDYVTGCVMGAD